MVETLSDKINNIDDNWEDTIDVESVKSFIEQLKEAITYMPDHENVDLLINKIIDKLAGDKLI